MTHRNAKLANVILRVIRNLCDRGIKFFFGFSQVEKDGVAIHEREMLTIRDRRRKRPRRAAWPQRGFMPVGATVADKLSEPSNCPAGRRIDAGLADHVLSL
jgi:hypothetical protein